jgi:hypothetical protein
MYMLDSLPGALSSLTISELEERFAGKKHDAQETISKFKVEVQTVLQKVEHAIEGCDGAEFFEHAISGVIVHSKESA